MILGNNGIRRELAMAHIVIEPFDDRLLNTNSYDVRIDDTYYTLTRSPSSSLVIDPGHPSLNQVWSGPLTVNYPGSNGEILPCVLVPPKGMILACTIEVIGAKWGYTTLLKAKSTMARFGLEICASAGFGDVGFVNKWTLEISNHLDRHIYIPVGTRVAQIAFTAVDTVEGQYEGNYVQQKEWDPSQMLPVVKPHIRI